MPAERAGDRPVDGAKSTGSVGEEVDVDDGDARTRVWRSGVCCCEALEERALLARDLDGSELALEEPVLVASDEADEDGVEPLLELEASVRPGLLEA